VSGHDEFAGGETLDFDLSGIELRLEGVPPLAAEAFRRDWAAFRERAARSPFLRVSVRRVEAEAAPGSRFDPKSMRAELARERASFHMPEGRIDLDREGHARLGLREGLGAAEYFTLLNLVRAALAWSLPSRGAVLLHAAAIVLAGRGFALAGPEGSGKSTWAALGERAGAAVLSDDLIVLARDAHGFCVLGAPFRSTHRVAFRRGRWPLGALLFPRHGPAPALAPVPPLLAQARILANLPFVAEALERDERLEAVVQGLAAGTRCLELTFAADTRFVELLRDLDG